MTIERRPMRVWPFLLAILFLAGALRIYGLGEQPFWLDEAHTADFTTLTVGELWSFEEPFDTVNPPGFILLMKAWTQVSRSDVWFRLLSALAGVATVGVVYAAGRKAGGARAGLVAAAFVALAGYHVRYSQEARAYALITLCAAVAMWAVLQLVTEPEGDRATVVRPGWRPIHSAGPSGRRAVTWTDVAWIAYGVAAGSAMHLHNTGIGIVLASNLAVGIWWLAQRPRPIRFARNWLGAHVLALVVFGPWIPGFITQLGLVQENFWVTAPTASSVTRDLGVVFDSYGGLLWEPLGSLGFHAAIVATVALTVWLGTSRLDLGRRMVIVAFVVVQPLFELAFSLRQPVFLSRTLLWIVLGVAVAVGIALTSRANVIAKAVAGLLLITQVVGVIGYHHSFQKTAWDQAAAVVAEQAGPDDVVLVLAGNTQVAFDHYFDGYGLDIPVIAIPWGIPGRTSSGAVLTSTDLEALVELSDEYATTWLVLNSVGNIENADTLRTELRAVSESMTPYPFPDVRVISFD